MIRRRAWRELRTLAALGALVALTCLATAAPAQDEGTGKPPFITTPANVADRMLAIAGTGPADLVVDLGSGDGRIVIAAAAKYGARGIGLELDPALVAASRDNARAAGVADRTEFRVADVLKADFSNASVVTAYLLPWLLARLGNTLLYELRPGTRIVTHAFTLSGWQPDRSEKVIVAAPDPKVGAETTIHLWTVPAHVRGEWQSAAPSEWRLRIRQNFQEIDVDGTAESGARVDAAGRLDGTRIAFTGSMGSPASRFTYTGTVGDKAIAGTAEFESAGSRRSLPLTLTLSR